MKKLTKKENSNQSTTYLGYLTLFMKFTSDDSVYYAKYTSDFSKPITEKFMDTLLHSCKLLYQEAYGQILTGSFCTKEEYEVNDDERDSVSTSWHDADCDYIVENEQMLHDVQQWTYELIACNKSSKQEHVLQTYHTDMDINEILEDYQEYLMQTSLMHCNDVLILVRYKYQSGRRVTEYYKNKEWYRCL